MSEVPVVDYHHYYISDVPVVDLSPGDRVLNLLSCLPWTGARARLVPRCPDVFHPFLLIFLIGLLPMSDVF